MEKSTTGQSNNGQPQVETLHTRIASFEHLLNEKAVFLDKKRCSTNNYVHWKARGSQQTLWEVTRYLRVARRFYCSPSALHTALQEYLECLQTSQEDAKWDVARLPRPQRGMPIVQWKAEGEILVLTQICLELAAILKEYKLAGSNLITAQNENQPVSVAS